jgi:hypothetical protein
MRRQGIKAIYLVVFIVALGFSQRIANKTVGL